MSAWIAYCYPNLFKGELNDIIEHMKPQWINHPIFKNRK